MLWPSIVGPKVARSGMLCKVLVLCGCKVLALFGCKVLAWLHCKVLLSCSIAVKRCMGSHTASDSIYQMLVSVVVFLCFLIVRF